MARRIETEVGILIGKVDRVARSVAWHLECPECISLIPLDEDTFHGRKGAVCECGWKAKAEGTKERSENGGIYVFPDYTAVFNPDGAADKPPITRGMRL